MAIDQLAAGEKPSRRNTALWVSLTGGAQGVKFLLTFASVAILGRLLSPEDFGLVAAAAPFLALATLLQGLGLNQAIVQKQELKVPQIHALFYVTLGLSVPIGAVLWFAAPAIASFFDDDRLTGVIRVMSAVSVLSAMSATPIGILSRGHRFGTLATIEICSAVAGVGAAIAVAIIFRHYWAIVMVGAVTTLTQLVLSVILSGWRPGAPSYDESTRSMVAFGAGFSAFSVANFFSRNADNWLIARFSGMTALGLYDMAYKLMLNPLQQSLQPFSKVMVPVLSRLQDNSTEYASRYFETTFVILALVQPPLIVAAVFAEPVIVAILGEQWTDATPIFSFLVLTSLHQAFTSTLGWLFISQGRGWDFALLGLLGASVSVIAFMIGVTWGPVGVAAAYAIADYTIRAPLAWILAGRKGHVSTLALGRFFLPHVFAMAVSAAGLLLIRQVLPAPGLVLLCLLGVASYLLMFAGLAVFNGKRAGLLMLRDGVVRQVRRVTEGRSS